MSLSQNQASQAQSLSFTADVVQRLQAINTDVRSTHVAPTTLNQRGSLVYPDYYSKDPVIARNLTAIAKLWEDIEQELEKRPFSADENRDFQSKLSPFLNLSPFTQLCIDPKVQPGHPALVRMLLTGRISHTRELQYEGLRAGASIFEQLDPMGALIQYFHTHTAAASAHRNRFRTISEALPVMVESLTPEHRSILLNGVGATCELSSFNLQKVWKVFIHSPNKSVLESAADFLTRHRGVSDVKTAHTKSSHFVFGKTPDARALKIKAGITLCLGMMDYVPKNPAQDKAKEVVRRLIECTTASGYIGVSFISDRNPHKLVLNTVLNWDLQHRSRDEIQEICSAFGLKKDNGKINEVQKRGTFRIIAVPPDETNYLLLIRKAR